LDETLYPNASAVLVPVQKTSSADLASFQAIPDLPDLPAWIPMGELLSSWSLPVDSIVVGRGFFRLPDNRWTEAQKNFTQKLLDFLARQTPGDQNPRDEPTPYAALILENFAPPTPLPEHPKFQISQASWRNGVLTGRVRLKITDPQATEATRLDVQVRCQIPAAVLTRDVQAGTPVQALDWNWVWQIAQKVPWDALTQDKMPLYRGTSFTARLDLKAGDYLRPSGNVTLVRPVNRGDAVKLTIDEGPLSVELPAIAMESGVEGQTVRVLTNTGKVLKVVVDGTRSTHVDWP
jgi:flagella basal body P-ring formation protein FlgA